jgi:hypothetical protein
MFSMLVASTECFDIDQALIGIDCCRIDRIDRIDGTG